MRHGHSRGGISRIDGVEASHGLMESLWNSHGYCKSISLNTSWAGRPRLASNTPCTMPSLALYVYVSLNVTNPVHVTYHVSLIIFTCKWPIV